MIEAGNDFGPGTNYGEIINHFTVLNLVLRLARKLFLIGNHHSWRMYNILYVPGLEIKKKFGR